MDRAPEALAGLDRALSFDPKNSRIYNARGRNLVADQRPAEAIAAFRKAIELDPKYVEARIHLADVFLSQKRYPEAIARCQEAIDLGATYADAYRIMGAAYAHLKRLPEASAAFEKALEIQPNAAGTRRNLGIALADQKRYAEAIVMLQKSIDAEPRAETYTNLGMAFVHQKKPADAIAAFQQAIKLNPKDAFGHNNLGGMFFQQGRFKEAVSAYQDAVAVLPKYDSAYFNLGMAYSALKQYPEAVASFRKAIEIQPNSPAYGPLGEALLQQGEFAKAEAATQRALASLPPKHPLRPLVQGQLERCQAMLKLEGHVQSVLAGMEPAKLDELRVLVELCERSGDRRTMTARLYGQIFKVQATLAEKAGMRFRAARAAASAGLGHGEDAVKLTPEEKATLRRQAQILLRADLGVCAKQLPDAKAEPLLQLSERLQQWQQDADLAGVRDLAALHKLPREERAVWQQLWADVQRLLHDAEGRFVRTRVEGSLTGQEPVQVHELDMTAGRTYVVDLESAAFDALLRIEDAAGQKLAENDDIDKDNTNARLVFRAPADGVFRLVATSFEERGTGPYTLQIRELVEKK
jgi:tetratricopeptide (TPR) repeat protein